MTAEEMDRSEEAQREEDQMMERIPCPDESCIGTMGSDGYCRVCGRKGEKPAAAPDTAPGEAGNTVDEAAGEDPPATAEAEEQPEIDAAHEDTASPPDDDWDQRQLCADESCIGTLGRDGRCRVCGQPGDPGTKA